MPILGGYEAWKYGGTRSAQTTFHSVNLSAAHHSTGQCLFSSAAEFPQVRYGGVSE